MPVHDGDAIATVVGALGGAGRRGLLLTPPGLAGEVDLPDSVLAIEPCPHDWLFPRVAAAVHHGGAGTTAAALRAGVPSVVVPFFADQPFWAWRGSAPGAGPPPPPPPPPTARPPAAPRGAAARHPPPPDPAPGPGPPPPAEDGPRPPRDAV